MNSNNQEELRYQILRSMFVNLQPQLSPQRESRSSASPPSPELGIEYVPLRDNDDAVTEPEVLENYINDLRVGREAENGVDDMSTEELAKNDVADSDVSEYSSCEAVRRRTPSCHHSLIQRALESDHHSPKSPSTPGSQTFSSPILHNRSPILYNRSALRNSQTRLWQYSRTNPNLEDLPLASRISSASNASSQKNVPRPLTTPSPDQQQSLRQSSNARTYIKEPPSGTKSLLTTNASKQTNVPSPLRTPSPVQQKSLRQSSNARTYIKEPPPGDKSLLTTNASRQTNVPSSLSTPSPNKQKRIRQSSSVRTHIKAPPSKTKSLVLPRLSSSYSETSLRRSERIRNRSINQVSQIHTSHQRWNKSSTGKVSKSTQVKKVGTRMVGTQTDDHCYRFVMTDTIEYDIVPVRAGGSINIDLNSVSCCFCHQTRK